MGLAQVVRDFEGARGRGFEVDYLDAGGVRRSLPVTACSEVLFEDVDPVRGFGWVRGQRHFPGWWWSATTRRLVGFESWLEREQAMVLDFDPEVLGFSSQPFWLSWDDGARVRRHAPDFFARLKGGGGVVVDVRADDRLDPAAVASFQATQAACVAAGWRVGVLDPVFGANLRWLSRYRHPRCGARGQVIEGLREVFAAPRALFEGCELVGDRILVLPAVYHLLWTGVLTVSLAGEPLGPDTLVWLSDGGTVW
jgi:hypothetical protein